MSNPLRILLLYQYDHATQSAPPSIIDEFRKLLHKQTYVGSEIITRTLSEWTCPNARLITFMEKFSLACKSFDAVLAFLTHDERPASAAGNLWLEVGYWLAARDGRDIRIVKHVYGDGRDGVIVEPTNLGTIPVTRVRDAHGAFEVLMSLVNSWTSRPFEHNPFAARIRQALPGASGWPDYLLSKCGSASEPYACATKLPALAMFAELTRFLEVMAPSGAICAHLTTIQHSCTALCDATTIGRSEVRVLLNRINHVINALKKFGGSPVVVHGEDSAWPHWFLSFLKTHGFTDPEFCEQLAHHLGVLAQDSLRDSAWYVKGKPQERNALDMSLRRSVQHLALNSAAVVAGLREYFARHTANVLTTVDANFQTLESWALGAKLDQTLRTFGHNIPNGDFAPIWPPECAL